MKVGAISRAVYAYSAYGETAVLGPDGGNELQYAGLRNDGTGFYQAIFRYYDVVGKQWLSEDPLGLRGGINQRRYVGGNPTGSSDPLGLCDPDDYICQATAGQSTIPVTGRSSLPFTSTSCGCSGGFTNRWSSAYSTTMATTPGIGAIAGMGFFGANSFARAGGGQTWGQWWNMPNWSVPRMPVPIGQAVRTSALKWAVYGAAYSAGVAVGSGIYAGLTCD